MLPVSLDCPFSIALSVLSNVSFYVIISWVKVFSILTDFSLLGKVQTVLEIRVIWWVFLWDEVHIFDKEIKKFEKILICFKSCWFLYQSPIHLWNVTMLVSIYTPKPPSSLSSLYDPHRWHIPVGHLIVEHFQYLPKKTLSLMLYTQYDMDSLTAFWSVVLPYLIYISKYKYIHMSRLVSTDSPWNHQRWLAIFKIGASYDPSFLDSVGGNKIEINR